MNRLRIMLTLLACSLNAHAQIPDRPALPVSAIVNISQFGAKGDGITDDTRAFVGAIAAAANAGQQLRLDSRTYLLTATLKIPPTGKAFSIIGAENTRLLWSPAASLDSGFVISKGSGIELRSFTILGANGGLNHAISITDSTNIQMDHLRIESIHGTGPLSTAAILLSTDNQIWITNSRFTDIGGEAGKPSLVIWNYYRAHSANVYIAHNQFEANTANIVIGLFDTDHSMVVDNKIDEGNQCISRCNNNGYGVLFYRSDYHGLSLQDAPKLGDETVADNHISNTAGSAIYLQGVSNSKVSNNTISRSTLQMDDSSLPGSAIALNYADNVQIFNNVINADAKGGICLATTRDVAIQGNQIHDSAKWGIHLRTQQLRTAISNNTIDGAPVGVLIEHDAAETQLANGIQTRVGQPIRRNGSH